MIELQITQRFARIGLEINDARYELNKQKPDLQMEQIEPDVRIQTTKASLEIDYRPMLESMGFGGIWFMTRSLSAKCNAEFEQNLATTVQTGNRIGKIENDTSIGDAIFDAMAPPESDVTIASLAPIQISYNPAEVHPSAELGDIKYSANLGKVAIDNYVFPSVHAFLEQSPYIKIETVGQAIDLNK